MALSSKATPDTILLKGTGERREGIAGGAVTPGHLVVVNSSDRVVVNPTAADADAQRAFAVENELQGDEIGTAYALNDRIFYHVMRAGDEVLAWLDAGENVAIGASLESAANGRLQALSTGRVVGYALEALDLSQTGDVTTRIKVRVA